MCLESILRCREASVWTQMLTLILSMMGTSWLGFYGCMPMLMEVVSIIDGIYLYINLSLYICACAFMRACVHACALTFIQKKWWRNRSIQNFLTRGRSSGVKTSWFGMRLKDQNGIVDEKWDAPPLTSGQWWGFKIKLLAIKYLCYNFWQLLCT